MLLNPPPPASLTIAQVAQQLAVHPKTVYRLVERGRLVLRLENGMKALAGERVFNRLRQLARLIGREPAIATD